VIAGGAVPNDAARGLATNDSTMQTFVSTIFLNDTDNSSTTPITSGRQTFRFQKSIVPCKSMFPKTPTVLRLSAAGEPDENAKWHAEVLRFLNALNQSGKLEDWNQVAFLFRSVRNERVVDLARFLENKGIPVYSPRSNMFLEREEVRLMIGALIFLFPQFPKVRQWAKGVHLSIWDYYDQQCFRVFTEELRKPENKRLLDWARPLAKRNVALT